LSYEIEQQSRTELATSARRLRVQLDQSISEFSMFGRELRQVMAEGMEETRLSIDKMLETGMSQFSLGIENMTQTIESSNKSFDNRNMSMMESSDRLVVSISSLGERIDNVRVSEDILADQLGPAVKNLFQAAEQIATASARVADNIKDINFPSEMISEGLVSAVASLKEGAGELRAAAAAESGKADKWKGAIDNMVQVSVGLKEHMSGLERSVTGLNATVGNIATGTAAMNQLPSTMDALQKKLDTMLNLMQQNIDLQVSLVHRLQATIPQTTDSQNEPGMARNLLNKFRPPGGGSR